MSHGFPDDTGQSQGGSRGSDPSGNEAQPSRENPFADEPSPPSSNDSPYAPPLADPAPYRPGGYETTLPHRGGLILTLGLTGLLVGTLGILCCFPFNVAALALTVPAWVLGHLDLKAIKSGAMQPEGRALTMTGYVMGIVGTLLTLIITAGLLGGFAYLLMNDVYMS